MDILEWVQKHDVNMIKGLEDLQCEKWLRELRLCSLEKPIMCVNIWWGQSKEYRIRLFSVVECSARGSEHKVQHRKLYFNTTKTIFFQRWSNTCTSYPDPERLWRLHLWRHSKPNWTSHSRCSFFEWRVGWFPVVLSKSRYYPVKGILDLLLALYIPWSRFS